MSNDINPVHHHHHHDEDKPSLEKAPARAKIITIRPHSGLSGDMILTGLAALSMKEQDMNPDDPDAVHWFSDQLGLIMKTLPGTVKIVSKQVGGICGWNARVKLPEEHAHRTVRDIKEIIQASSLAEEAKKLALDCFELLARCEANAHGIEPEAVHFHEVGALDSILDICGVCHFYQQLGSPALVCGPLPIADGSVHCQHGILPAPAPAVLELLKGLACGPFPACGETVTPTAAALLHSLQAVFDLWPLMRITETALVYGTKIFPHTANGAIFAMGERLNHA